MRRPGAPYEALLLFIGAACFALAGVGRSLVGEGIPLVPRQENHLRVVTWNVGSGLLQGGGGLNDESLAHVAELLERMDPDLVLLQEVTGLRQLTEILQALGDGWVGKISRGAGKRRVVALAHRGALSRFDTGHRDRVLGLRYQRTAGPELILMGLHADAFSSRNRNEEIGAAITDLRNQGGAGPRILLGDLNLDLDIDKRRDLFTDDEYLDVETYNYLVDGMLDAALGMGPTAEPDRRLDYIIVDPSFFEVHRAGPLKGYRASGMDHDPLLADLILLAPE